MSEKKPPITIKKYANRRLYNTESSSYVTLDFLSQLVRDDVDFVVLDAKSGDDITRQVLTQIIFEEENNGSNLLSVNFLRDLISYYGKSVQGFFPSYLEMSMKNFEQSQEQWRKAFQNPNSQPFDMFSNAMKANVEMFTKAAAAMNPQNYGIPIPGTPSKVPTKAEKDEESAKEQLKLMQEQLKAMQEQINKMANKAEN